VPAAEGFMNVFKFIFCEVEKAFWFQACAFFQWIPEILYIYRDYLFSNQ
jgi:hypothetical protein